MSPPSSWAPTREFHLPFFFNDPATTEIYALPLPAALPISPLLTNGRPRRWVLPLIDSELPIGIVIWPPLPVKRGIVPAGPEVARLHRILPEAWSMPPVMLSTPAVGVPLKLAGPLVMFIVPA